MDRQADELFTLKVIAETLNRSNDMRDMLQQVLERLLEVTGLKTGWIFLSQESSRYEFVADVNLPPALARDQKLPMCNGSCHCLSQYWSGTLKQAVNIINCKRISDAIRQDRGDTGGITHHATVPLTAGGEKFGVLNVTSPNKSSFTDAELNLLQSVAYQIGTAIKRMRLYEEQEKSASTYQKLDEVVRHIWENNHLEHFHQYVVQKIAAVFGLTDVLLFLKNEDHFDLVDGRTDSQRISQPYLIEEKEDYNLNKEGRFELTLLNDESYSCLPIKIGNENLGFLAINANENLEAIDPSGLKALAVHLALAIENIRLNERQQELNIMEERNRLARDLHDAVNQKLFSLSLTAKGARRVAEKDSDILIEALEDMQRLSREALTEMRAMIWQLRPAPSDKNLLKTIASYSSQLGIQLHVKNESNTKIPEECREHLFRILQEGINNISKHAQVKQAMLNVKQTSEELVIELIDEGVGFLLNKKAAANSTLGLTSMKERIEKVNGSFNIKSSPGEGTKIVIQVPLKEVRGNDT